MNPKLVSLPIAALLLLPALEGSSQEAPPPPVKVAAAPAQAAPAQATPAQGTPAKEAMAKVGAPAQAAPAKAQQKTTPKQSTRGKNGKIVPPPAPPVMGQPGTPGRPAWMEFKLNPKTKMFLDFTEANPDMVISIFSRTSGITILKDPTFKTPLTIASAKPLGLNDAFELFNAVLNLNGYEVQKNGKFLMVGRKQPPPQPPSGPPPPQPQPLIKTYPLKNASATQLAKVINDVYGPPAGSPPPPMNPGQKPLTVKATPEEFSNSIIVSAVQPDHDLIEKFIKDLDKVASTTLESKLFALKYVPADQVLPAIQDILSANAPSGRSARKNDNQGGQFFFFGRGSNSQQLGGQTATAVKQTNSVIVNATPENLELVKSLLDKLDQPSSFVGTTFVIRLENAKAADLADLLNKALTEKSSGNDGFPFFFFSDFGDGSSNKKNTLNTDINEKGEIVNVRELLGKVNIIADPNTNSLVIVTQPSNMVMIREIISKLDRVADQVMIETIVVEANLDNTTKLGVEWNFPSTKLFGDSQTTGNGATNFNMLPTVGTAEGLTYTITGKQYKAVLNALQTETRFKVLDTPRIFTSNNVKAEINVSQKLPYITSQQTGINGGLISNYQFQDVGVVLTVTPRITASGQVTMEVIQSADDLQGFTSYNAPIINHRQASTTVSVNDGATIVLGGIIRHTLNVTNKKVPLLGDIPLLGNLFRSSSKTAGQTELMVFLTPHIVLNNKDAQDIRDKATKALTKPSQDNLNKVIPPQKADPPSGKP